MNLMRFYPRQFAPLFLSVLTLACMPSSSRAALIVTSATNTPTSFSAVLSWTANPTGIPDFLACEHCQRRQP